MHTDVDVIIVGYGPVGEVLAALLGRDGHRVMVFERHPDRYPTPRAGHFDHEVMRIFQSVGVADLVEAHSSPALTYEFLDSTGNTVAHLPREWQAPSGWCPSYHFYQPDVEQVLDDRARSFANVTVRRGVTVVDVEQNAYSSTVLLARTADGSPAGRVTARYVVAADGAGSSVRESSGIGVEDLGFRSDWLVVDIAVRDGHPVPDIPDTAQICNPDRPSFMARLLGRHLRWEFMLLPGDDPAQMVTDDSVRALLAPWIEPDGADIIRRTIYRFEGVLADRYRAGRVLLAGDAAHRMPPTLGQGMCSGIRDAATLSWQLDLVLRGVAEDTLLDEYEPARRRHCAAYIHEAIRIGQVVCETDPQRCADNLRALASATVAPPPFQPSIDSGIRAGDALAGTLAVQPTLDHPDLGAVRLDDVTGPGFQLITVGTWYENADVTRPGPFDDAVRLHRVHLAETPGAALHETGDRLTSWLAEAGVSAVLVRPDQYVYGTADSPEAAAELVGHLLDHLHLTDHDMTRQPVCSG